MSTNNLPRRIRVAEVLDSRYGPGKRPVSWDERRSDIETVQTDTGEKIILLSGGGQSSPAPGWEILLTKEHPERSTSTGGTPVSWTLYGIPKTTAENDKAKSGNK